MKKVYFLLFLATAMLILSGNAAAQNLPAYLPSNGLVAWYPFNGNANDESGNGNHGTVNGATLTSDRVGNVNSAYLLDGLSNLIEVPAAFNLGSSSKSFAVWFNVRNANYSWIVSGGLPNTNGQAFGFYFDESQNYGQYPHKLIFHGDSPTFDFGFSDIVFQVWNHVVVIYDGLSISAYLNGQYMGSKSMLLNTSSYPIKLGCRGNYTEFFDGDVDDFAIYNRALTQEEITALYTGTPASNNNGGNTTANAVPPGIPYQAVVRNANGQVAANAAATTKFTLHQNTIDGAVEYQETHALTTNAQGLVSAVIGQGTAVQGTFGGINWSNTTKFLQVEVDLGNGYVDLGTQQLMSVPFALYAANGPAGPQGPAGADGADGATGPAGPQGPAGSGGFTHWVGESFGGGVVFHLFRDELGQEHGLIVSLNNIGYFTQWGFDGIDLQGCSSTWDGFTNSSTIVSSANTYQGIAAQICDNYEGLGFNDWYLPAIDELVLLFNARFQVHKTLGQISNSDVLKDTIGEYYWSSTEINSSQVKTFDFYSGHIQFTTKMYGLHHIRAIRSF